MGLTNIYRTVQLSAKEYNFYSAPHGTYSKSDYISDKKQASTDTWKLK